MRKWGPIAWCTAALLTGYCSITHPSRRKAKPERDIVTAGVNTADVNFHENVIRIYQDLIPRLNQMGRFSSLDSSSTLMTNGPFIEPSASYNAIFDFGYRGRGVTWKLDLEDAIKSYVASADSRLQMTIKELSVEDEGNGNGHVKLVLNWLDSAAVHERHSDK